MTSAQHQCLLRSVFLPIPQMHLLLSLTQMNIENKSTLILVQVRLGKKRDLFPILVTPSCKDVVINVWFFGLATELLQFQANPQKNSFIPPFCHDLGEDERGREGGRK